MTRMTAVARVLLVGLLLAQGALVAAEIQHTLHTADETCNTCLVAEHVSHGLTPIAPTLAMQPPVQADYQVVIRLPDQDITPAYLSRAPPRA